MPCIAVLHGGIAAVCDPDLQRVLPTAIQTHTQIPWDIVLGSHFGLLRLLRVSKTQRLMKILSVVGGGMGHEHSCKAWS